MAVPSEPLGVEHLVIGAGVAGMTVAHLLGERAVVLDPHPERYKIGESIIPQHFQHPALRPVLERVRALPSACPKTGTLFVTAHSASYFPILDDALPAERALAVHVERAELERAQRECLKTQVRKERVVAVDFDTRVVTTTERRYRVGGVVVDCSGPAMFVARRLGIVRELWPIWAGWGYFDVERVERERFFEWLGSGEREYLRYDGVARGLVRGGERAAFDPSHVTLLTAIAEGIWSWQIPLFGAKLLSFGVVSRNGPVTEDQYRALTRQALGPQYVARLRPFDHTGPFSVFHQRQGFARAATEYAGEGWALVGDAAFFGDPVYSVGTGVAVSHATQLAELLLSQGWSAPVREAWQRQQRATFARVEQAYRNWYGGEVVADDLTATKIQNDFLIGDAFRVRLADDYMSLWAVAEAASPTAEPREGAGDSLLFEVVLSDERALLLLEPDPDGTKPALARAPRHALSHLDLELGPAFRQLLPSLRQRFAAAGADEPATALRAALGSAARVELRRRLLHGQSVPGWPLSLRSGRPAPRSLWPFDAEGAGLELGLRRAIFREGRSDEEARLDRTWLESRGFLVQARGRDLVAARDASVLARAVELISSDGDSAHELAERSRELGALLGYPACCIESFVSVRRRDDLWLFADVLPRHAEPVPACSLFLNGALALVSHAPCSARCPATLELGAALLARLEHESPGFSGNWLALARRLHAIDERGRCFAFDVTGVDELEVRSALEIVAPSAGVSAPYLRPTTNIRSLRVDRERALLISDDGQGFRSALFARHDG